MKLINLYTLLDVCGGGLHFVRCCCEEHEMGLNTITEVMGR